jgi:Flp pilus assembly protein TadG
MDGAQEVERKHAALAVSAIVHTRAWRRVSFGEPAEESGGCGYGMTLAFQRFGQFDRKSNYVRVRASSGQTVVEVALLLPLLLLLLVGLIELGRYAYFDILISNAARAGAQYGAQSLIQAADVAGIRRAAQNDGLAAMTITATQQCGCAAASLGGCPTGAVCPQPLVYVQVTATDRYNSLFRYPGIPRNLTLTSTVTMRVSQ